MAGYEPEECQNINGACTGVNTAIYSPSGANSGVGFAVPVDIINSSVTQIIKFGKVIRPILGISFAPDQSIEQVCSLLLSCKQMPVVVSWSPSAAKEILGKQYAAAG